MSNNEKKPSLGQVIHLLNLINQKGTSLENLNLLFTSGFLSDLLEADLLKLSRIDFRKFLGLTNYNVQVDRSIYPDYPFVEPEILDLQMQKQGPLEYDLSEVYLWPYYHSQLEREIQSSKEKSMEVYSFLKSVPRFTHCLNLQDALAIQMKGVEVFRLLYGELKVFFWASAVKLNYGKVRIMVPYLYIKGNKVKLDWMSGIDAFKPLYLALCFEKK